VSYIAYIGGLDLALCYVLAREIGQRIGLEPEEFGFRWNLTSSQFHGFKSLPLLYSLNYEDLLLHEGEYPSAKYPTLRLVRKWHAGVVGDHEAGVPLTEQKYGPLRRIRRRYEEFKDGTRYSTPLDQLTLAPLRERG